MGRSKTKDKSNEGSLKTGKMEFTVNMKIEAKDSTGKW